MGEEAAAAAWLVAQHAIGPPGFQWRCLERLAAAARAGLAPPWQAAFLEDRIRIFEGRAQRYGTQIDQGPDGMPRPFPVEAPEKVDERRRAIGLEPLAQTLAAIDPVPPADAAERDRRQREYEAWLRRVGWRA